MLGGTSFVIFMGIMRFCRILLASGLFIFILWGFTILRVNYLLSSQLILPSFKLPFYLILTLLHF